MAEHEIGRVISLLGSCVVGDARPIVEEANAGRLSEEDFLTLVETIKPLIGRLPEIADDDGEERFRLVRSLARSIADILKQQPSSS